jgi:spore maturation protein CgeB
MVKELPVWARYALFAFALLLCGWLLILIFLITDAKEQIAGLRAQDNVFSYTMKDIKEKIQSLDINGSREVVIVEQTLKSVIDRQTQIERRHDEMMKIIETLHPAVTHKRVDGTSPK